MYAVRAFGPRAPTRHSAEGGQGPGRLWRASRVNLVLGRDCPPASFEGQARAGLRNPRAIANSDSFLMRLRLQNLACLLSAGLASACLFSSDASLRALEPELVRAGRPDMKAVGGRSHWGERNRTRAGVGQRPQRTGRARPPLADRSRSENAPGGVPTSAPFGFQSMEIFAANRMVRIDSAIPVD